MTTHLCGAGLALLGFALSLVIGLCVGNPFTTLVIRAVLVLVLFYPLGCLLAHLGQKSIQENFDAHAQTLRPPAPAPADKSPEQTVV